MTGLSFMSANNSFDVILRLSITLPIIYPRWKQAGSRNVNLNSVSHFQEAISCQDVRKHFSSASVWNGSVSLWFYDLEGSDAQIKTILFTIKDGFLISYYLKIFNNISSNIWARGEAVLRDHCVFESVHPVLCFVIKVTP